MSAQYGEQCACAIQQRHTSVCVCVSEEVGLLSMLATAASSVCEQQCHLYVHPIHSHSHTPIPLGCVLYTADCVYSNRLNCSDLCRTHHLTRSTALTHARTQQRRAARSTCSSLLLQQPHHIVLLTSSFHHVQQKEQNTTQIYLTLTFEQTHSQSRGITSLDHQTYTQARQRTHVTI